MFDPIRLKELIEGSGVAFRSNSVSFIFTCPRCHKKDKLYIRKTNGQFICFVCKEESGFSGRPEFALAEILCQPIHEIRVKLYGEATVKDYATLNLKLNTFGNEEPEEESEIVIPEVCWGWSQYEIDHQHATQGASYLERRGISTSIAKEYGIRYNSVERSITFPITYKGRMVGWQTRIIDSDRVWMEELGKHVHITKSLTSKNLPKHLCVMFEHRLEGSDHAVLCEGPIDALKAHQCGGNIATMGKLVSRPQIELMKSHGVSKVYLALDPDASKEVGQLAQDLKEDFELYDMRPPAPHKDLGEMEMGAVLELFKTAPKVKPGQLFLHLNV